MPDGGGAESYQFGLKRMHSPQITRVVHLLKKREKKEKEEEKNTDERPTQGEFDSFLHALHSIESLEYDICASDDFFIG